MQVKRKHLGSGFDGTANTLELSDAELDRITAATLRIGRNDADASGTVNVSSAISLGGTDTLSLITGGAVTQSGAIDETNLAVTAGGAVSPASPPGVGTSVPIT